MFVVDSSVKTLLFTVRLKKNKQQNKNKKNKKRKKKSPKSKTKNKQKNKQTNKHFILLFQGWACMNFYCKSGMKQVVSLAKFGVEHESVKIFDLR